MNQPVVLQNHPHVWGGAYPWPKTTTNKYDRGHVLVIAGDELAGAGRLAALAALRTGAGLVTVACSPKDRLLYTLDAASLIVRDRPAEGEWATFIRSKKITTTIIGPGAAPKGEVLLSLKEVLAAQQSLTSIIIDAGALTAMGEDPSSWLPLLDERCLLTPHRGEYDRLFGPTADSNDVLSLAWRAVKATRASILLKGPKTVVASTQGAIVNTHASADLATAGTGDVLAGVIGGLAAQGMPLLYAAAAGAWIQGDAALRRGAGLIADDLVSEIPAVLKGLKAILRVV